MVSSRFSPHQTRLCMVKLHAVRWKIIEVGRSVEKSVAFAHWRPLSTLTLRHFAPPTRNNARPLRPTANLSPTPRRIAVVGGGLAGLATSYHLLHSIDRFLRKRDRANPPPPPTVTLFDPYPPSTAPGSSAAAGLLHKFTPRVKKTAWRASKSIDAAHHLIEIVSGDDPENVVKKCGLLRLAYDRKKVQDFLNAAFRTPQEVEYMEPDETVFRFPTLPRTASVFLPNAWVVNVPEYLNRLWRICERTGRAKWKQQHVGSMSDLEEYDTVIFCTGAYTKQLRELSHVPLALVRGRNLVFESGSPPVPVISGKYVIPDFFGRGIIAGATFEYREEFETETDYLASTEVPDVEKATAELSEHLDKLVPGLTTNRIQESTCGIRAIPPRGPNGAIPIVSRVYSASEKSVWLYTGLGSRGLLHHAFLGRCLARAVATGNEKLIPHESRRFELTLNLDGNEESDLEIEVLHAEKATQGSHS